MTEQGRGSSPHKSMDERAVEVLAAMVKLHQRQTPMTTHSIAREMGMSPSQHLRRIIMYAAEHTEGVFGVRWKKTNGWPVVYWSINTDVMYVSSRAVWDAVAQLVELQYPLPVEVAANDVPL